MYIQSMSWYKTTSRNDVIARELHPYRHSCTCWCLLLTWGHWQESPWGSCPVPGCPCSSSPRVLLSCQAPTLPCCGIHGNVSLASTGSWFLPQSFQLHSSKSSWCRPGTWEMKVLRGMDVHLQTVFAWGGDWGHCDQRASLSCALTSVPWKAEAQEKLKTRDLQCQSTHLVWITSSWAFGRQVMNWNQH